MSNSEFDTGSFEETVFTIATPQQFNALAMDLFHFQYQNNPVYHEYVDLLGRQRGSIPFLPIRFFKSKTIQTGHWNVDKATVFTSSGTTGDTTSRHWVKDVSWYERCFLMAFRLFYGEPTEWTILALLPSYLERSGSSLVYMTEKLIRLSKQKESGFFLNNQEELYTVLQQLEKQNRKTILLGVSFALLDFCERYSMNLKRTVVMETGGMKGRKKEMTRQELHAIYQKALGIESVHSEYGMTELLSQAYSKGEGRYFCPPWMKISIVSLNDPMMPCPTGETGRIVITDLANIYSCAFIATDDLGRINEDGSFEVLGRMDNSDLRGCSLLVS